MNTPRKIVLQSLNGYRTELDRLVKDWIDEGVKYVGIVGVDAAQIEDIIDDLCVGDGSAPYFMLTASHSLEETVEDAVIFAETLSDEYSGKALLFSYSEVKYQSILAQPAKHPASASPLSALHAQNLPRLTHTTQHATS